MTSRSAHGVDSRRRTTPRPGIGSPLTIDDFVALAQPAVTRVLRKRFYGATLSPSDDRRENERALDCFQQTMLELCAKFRRVLDADDPPILSVPDYAARVAHNVVNEHVRPPNWSRLTNRVRRVLSAEASVGLWEDPEQGRVAGYAGWHAQRQPAGSVALARQAFGDLRSDVVLATRWDNLTGGDWLALLSQLFDAAGGPLRLNALVLLLAEILDIESEVPWDDGEIDSVTAADEVPRHSAEDATVVRQQLRHLWDCSVQLRREWRLALLLNPPSIGDARTPERTGDASSRAPSRPRTSGRGTARGELDVFPAHGIASIAQIGAALELTPEECRVMAAALGTEAADFHALWRHLPLSDSAVGRLLGKSGMQVLALRKLAIRQVARCMSDRAGSAAGATRAVHGHIAARRTSASSERR